MNLLKRKIIAVAVSVAMVLGVFPASAPGVAYAETAFSFPEDIVSQGELFYDNKSSVESWSPMSLTQFAVKAAELDPDGVYSVAADTSAYVYAGASGVRFPGKDYPYYNLLGESDRIFDLIADGTDEAALQACVESLLDKQEDTGLFTAKNVSVNALSQARIILALDAYYGSDYAVEWGNLPPDEDKGRIAAIKALIGLWDPLNNRFKGSVILPYITNAALAPNGFQGTVNTFILTLGFPIIALSDYVDCPAIYDEATGKTVGAEARTTISKALASLEGTYKSTPDSLKKYDAAIYLIPALISIDGMRVDTSVMDTLGGVAVGNSNNTVNAQALIDTYGLFSGLGSLTVYSADGGLWTGAAKFEANAREYLTQQAVLAASDIINGETAWKRIVAPQAEDVNDVAADAKAIELPQYVYDHLELKTTGENGSAITWESGDPDTVAEDGTVTAPERGSKDITLTAKIAKGAASKEKIFIVTVKSNARDKAGEALSRMMEKFDQAYGKDISGLGSDGIFALKSIGRDFSAYTLAPLPAPEGLSAADCAKTVLRLSILDQNPYDQNGIDYVNLLSGINLNEGAECAWALLAFDAANAPYPSGLLDQVKALAVNPDAGLQDRGLAVCALSNHKREAGVQEALDVAKSALKDSQRTGRFGSDINEHASVVSALVSMGEDLSVEEYVQDNVTPLDILSAEEAVNLSAIIALGDLMAEKNVFQGSALTRAAFDETIKQAKNLLDNGSGIYSDNSLTVLRTAYDNAKLVGENDHFGKRYFELKTAIAGLSIGQLELSDKQDYTPESFAPFEQAAMALKNKLSQKTASAKEISDAAKQVTAAYGNLIKLDRTGKAKLFNATTAFTASTGLSDATSAPNKDAAKNFLDKLMTGYDAQYGYDVSSMGYWGVFEVAAMGKDVSKYKVYDVTTHKGGALTAYQATDFAAIILQLVLTGENPYDFNGVNYVEWLLKEDNGQGNFGPFANNIWALMALDAAGASYNENLINTVINQAKSASFDPDMRGWALAAIQNHKDKISSIEMDAIVTSIRSKMKMTGDSVATAATFGNVFTQGCIITGLNAAGVDMTTAEWTAEGLNPITALGMMQTEDGKFIVGANFDPGFVKDAVIALGDAVQGSNVWQRTCLTQELMDKAISDGETLLNGSTSSYSSAKIAALRSAVNNAKSISTIRGNGQIYYKLLDAIKDLTYVPIPEIEDADSYTYTTFSPFQSAVESVSQVLVKGEGTSAELNNLCEQVVAAYNALKNAEDVNNPLDVFNAIMNALPDPEDITSEDKDDLEAARDCYEALSDSDKELVDSGILTKYRDCQGIIIRLEAGDAAESAFKKILALPDALVITLNDKAQVKEARTAYNALTVGQQTLIAWAGTSALNRMTAAEDMIKRLEEPKNPVETTTVTFSLLGGEKHGDSKTVYIYAKNPGKFDVWIPETSYAFNSGSVTVYQVFMRAINEYGLDQVGAQGNYVSKIKAPKKFGGDWLAEFDNGTNSGWMYVINGTHPLYGLKEQAVSDGDKIVWHYTDDYTKEEGSDKWNSGSSAVSESDRTVTPTAKVSNGKASVSLSLSDMKDAIGNAKGGGDEIIIAPVVNGTVSSMEIVLKNDALKNIAEKTECPLTIQTPLGHVAIPNGALDSIASQAEGNTITVIIEAVDKKALIEEQQKLVSGSVVFDISILSGNKKISSFDGKSITISLPYTLKDGETADGVTVWYLNDKGELEKIACKYNKATGMATFTTDHLSCYVVGYSKAWQNPFTDVKSTDWFYGAVEFASKNSLFNGTAATTFGPNSQMTRAMLVTVLYRLAGSPAVTGTTAEAMVTGAGITGGAVTTDQTATTAFTDVKDGQWYTDAVAWADANGIVSGMGNGFFGTNNNVTREQLATILYNYSNYKGYEIAIPAAAGMEGFADATAVSSWAQIPMKWANSEKLITGRTAATLAPGGGATRAEVATILKRFAEVIAK